MYNNFALLPCFILSTFTNEKLKCMSGDETKSPRMLSCGSGKPSFRSDPFVSGLSLYWLVVGRVYNSEEVLSVTLSVFLWMKEMLHSRRRPHVLHPCWTLFLVSGICQLISSQRSCWQFSHESAMNPSPLSYNKIKSCEKFEGMKLHNS